MNDIKAAQQIALNILEMEQLVFRQKLIVTTLKVNKQNTLMMEDNIKRLKAIIQKERETIDIIKESLL